MKHKLIINTLLLTILCGCSNTVSSSDSQISASSNYTKPESFKVYDVYLDDGYPSNKTFVLEEFEDQSFYVDDKSKAITNNTYGTVMGYCSAVYVFDANNDGYRDFCTVKSNGSGVIYWYVSIYDLHNQKEIFYYFERLRFSYFLTLKDDALFVKQTKTYFNDETINEGKLSFNKDKGVYIEWNRNYDISDFDVNISLANPSHTPVTIKKEKDINYVTVDTVSQYFFDINIHSNVAYEMNKMPISFALEKSIFSLSSISRSDTLQRYCFFFQEEKGSEVIIDITISNIVKRYVFKVNSGGNSLRLKDVYPWAKELTSDNITMFELEYEDSLVDEGMKSINRHYDKEAFISAINNFNQIAFEISSDDFSNNIRQNTYSYTYRFYLENKKYEFEVLNSLFIEANGRWYRLRTFYEPGNSTGYQRYKAFTSSGDCFIYKIDNTDFNTSINYLNELLFSEKSNYTSDRSIEEAKYYFEIANKKYYILSAREFLSEDARYLYTIVSEKDFAFLF